MTVRRNSYTDHFDERWLEAGGIVPVDPVTTGLLIREVQRLRPFAITGESLAYRKLWAEHVEACGERTILKITLRRLIEAERLFTKDTGIKLNDLVSERVDEAEAMLNRLSATSQRPKEG